MGTTDFLIAFVVRMPSFMSVKKKPNTAGQDKVKRLRKTYI